VLKQLQNEKEFNFVILDFPKSGQPWPNPESSLTEDFLFFCVSLCFFLSVLKELRNEKEFNFVFLDFPKSGQPWPNPESFLTEDFLFVCVYLWFPLSVLKELQNEKEFNFVFLDFPRSQFVKRGWMEFRRDTDEHVRCNIYMYIDNADL